LDSPLSLAIFILFCFFVPSLLVQFVLLDDSTFSLCLGSWAGQCDPFFLPLFVCLIVLPFSRPLCSIRDTPQADSERLSWLLALLESFAPFKPPMTVHPRRFSPPLPAICVSFSPLSSCWGVTISLIGGVYPLPLFSSSLGFFFPLALYLSLGKLYSEIFSFPQFFGPLQPFFFFSSTLPDSLFLFVGISIYPSFFFL